MTLEIRIGSTYEKRDIALRSLGYPDYWFYLQSELWADIRNRVLDRDGQLCVACRTLASQVHHTDYFEDTLLGTRLDALVSICRRCHEAIEFQGPSGKRTLKRANLKLVELMGKQRPKHQATPAPGPKSRRQGRKICRACGKPKSRIGKEGICLDCFKKHGPKIHDVAARRDSKRK